MAKSSYSQPPNAGYRGVPLAGHGRAHGATRVLLAAVLLAILAAGPLLAFPVEAQTPTVTPAADTATGTKAKKIWFRVRINANTLSWFNEVAGPDDQPSVHSRDVALLDQITAGRKQVLFASAAEAERVVPTIASKIEAIAYDLEHWPQTPDDEQSDPVAAVQRLRELCDEYGLLLTLGPDRRFTAQYGAQMAPYADEYILQVQRLQANPASLLSFTEPLIDELRAANPGLKIIIQLRPEGTVDDMLGVVGSLYDQIDGVSLLTNTESMPVAREFISRLQAGEGATAALATRPVLPATTPGARPTWTPLVTERTSTPLIPTASPTPRVTRPPTGSGTAVAQVTPSAVATEPATLPAAGTWSVPGALLPVVAVAGLVVGGLAVYLYCRRRNCAE